MVNTILHGGKSSPRLLRDLQHYNPQSLSRGDDNILTHLPPPYSDTSDHSPRYKLGDCQHTWVIKERQSEPLGATLTSLGMNNVAACCTGCRTHLNLKLSTKEQYGSGWPCNGMHHFIYEAERSQGFDYGALASSHGWDDQQYFRCSMDGCPNALLVAMSSPVLSQNSVELLTDREKITARAKAAIAADRERMEGVAIPVPVTVLNNLKTYLLDATKNATPKPIAANNKRWLVSLGQSCSVLLNRLGFVEEEGRWLPPKPTVDAKTPLEDEFDILLDDVMIELNILIGQQPQHDRQQTQIRPDVSPAQNEMATLLNCKDYKKNPKSASQAQSSYDEEHPWYACLGAVMDFHDDLIKEAYLRQIACDPPNEPHYFDCLTGIAHGRNSEELQTVAAVQESEGVVGIMGIENAYRSLGLEMSTWGYTDENIIGHFEARITDAPRQEHDLRQALAIIGKHRNSNKIREFAANSVSSYEQAMNWLGTTEDMTDEFIVTMAGIKINDDASQEGMVRRAVEMIANKRNSGSLRAWLNTGEMGESSYSPEQAYARLGCSTDCQADTLAVAYRDAVSQQPSQKGDLQRALRALAEHLNSPLLRNYCEGDSPNYTNPEMWPVGLENLSNVCHFNSILQMLFSVKPFRELIINSEGLKKSMDADEIRRFTVGNRAISRSEVRHGQEFLDDMRNTFIQMVSSPVGYVVPDERMVENAFDTTLVSPDARSPSGGLAKDPFERIDATITRSSSDTVVTENGPTSESADVKMSEATGETTDEVASESVLQTEETAPSGPEPMQVEEKEVGTVASLDTLPKLQPPAPFTKDTSFRQQQDVTETAGNMFFRLCCAIAATNTKDAPGSEQQDPIIDLLFGRSKDLNADTGAKTSEQSTLFNIVSVNTRDTLEEAIESNWCYVPEGSSIYRYTSILKLPPVFQVQINRRQYSAERGAWKDEHDVKIPETLYLGHFLDSADDAVKKQWREIARTILAIDRDAGDRRDALTKIATKSQTKLSPSDLLRTMSLSLEHVASTVGENDEDYALFKQLSAEIIERQKSEEDELANLEQNITSLKEKLKTMRDNLPKEVPYKLHSVAVHRGTATSGHYFVYIYDFKQKMWRKYNDKIVEQADASAAAIFHNFKGSDFNNTDTPFFLTYVAADHVEEIVDPVHRIVERPSVDINLADAEVFEGIPVEMEEVSTGAKLTELQPQQVSDEGVW